MRHCGGRGLLTVQNAALWRAGSTDSPECGTAVGGVKNCCGDAGYCCDGVKLSSRASKQLACWLAYVGGLDEVERSIRYHCIDPYLEFSSDMLRFEN
jgi:hypothetical protein